MENKPAFPVNNGGKSLDKGMTLRDYFAAKALFIAWDEYALRKHRSPFLGDESMAELTATSYRLADSMLKAREE